MCISPLKQMHHMPICRRIRPSHNDLLSVDVEYVMYLAVTMCPPGCHPNGFMALLKLCTSAQNVRLHAYAHCRANFENRTA